MAFGSFGSLVFASANHSSKRRNGSEAAVKSPEINCSCCSMGHRSVQTGVISPAVVRADGSGGDIFGQALSDLADFGHARTERICRRGELSLTI
ncbi:hypothetical protein [Bosea sp. 117]|uniref:hypothetical protein n=1 Tax=Bosea sp. 117 TaxID=1125973 RepID=UPI0018CC4B67|nr:hypothetical protein [Bosea sp. 117]